MHFIDYLHTNGYNEYRRSNLGGDRELKFIRKSYLPWECFAKVMGKPDEILSYSCEIIAGSFVDGFAFLSLYASHFLCLLLILRFPWSLESVRFPIVERIRFDFANFLDNCLIVARNFVCEFPRHWEDWKRSTTGGNLRRCFSLSLSSSLFF